MQDCIAPYYSYMNTDNLFRSLENDKVHHNFPQFSQNHTLYIIYIAKAYNVPIVLRFKLTYFKTY